MANRGGVEIEFHADKMKVYGPKVDGSYKVEFEVGEYEQLKIAQLLAIPQRTTISVKVGADAENSEKA